MPGFTDGLGAGELGLGAGAGFGFEPDGFGSDGFGVSTGILSVGLIEGFDSLISSAPFTGCSVCLSTVGFG